MLKIGSTQMTLCHTSPRRLTCGYANGACMLMLRSRSHSPSRRKGEPRRGRLARCTLVGLALFVGQMFSLERAYSADHYKTNHYRQWAFIQLNDLDEFYCIDELYYKESRWNPNARNGSHYGIPQGRSKYLATASGFKQVEWGIKYNYNRYGSMCNALNHYNIKGWH